MHRFMHGDMEKTIRSVFRLTLHDEAQDGQDEAQDGQDEGQDGQDEGQDGQDEA